jgi:hypothetical protein
MIKLGHGRRGTTGGHTQLRAGPTQHLSRTTATRADLGPSVDPVPYCCAEKLSRPIARYASKRETRTTHKTPSLSGSTGRKRAGDLGVPQHHSHPQVVSRDRTSRRDSRPICPSGAGDATAYSPCLHVHRHGQRSPISEPASAAARAERSNGMPVSQPTHLR